jgi:hypothetical protein
MRSTESTKINSDIKRQIGGLGTKLKAASDADQLIKAKVHDVFLGFCLYFFFFDLMLLRFHKQHFVILLVNNYQLQKNEAMIKMIAMGPAHIAQQCPKAGKGGSGNSEAEQAVVS